VPCRALLIATGTGQALTATALGSLALLAVVRLEHLLLLTLLAGVLRGLEHAARQRYTHDVVGPAALLNGLAVLGVAMRIGWLLGSLGVGAVIAHSARASPTWPSRSGFSAVGSRCSRPRRRRVRRRRRTARCGGARWTSSSPSAVSGRC
jgi:hypothetical protein